MTDSPEVTIDLPDELVTWVEAQIAAGRFGSISEYVCFRGAGIHPEAVQILTLKLWHYPTPGALETTRGHCRD